MYGLYLIVLSTFCLFNVSAFTNRNVPSYNNPAFLKSLPRLSDVYRYLRSLTKIIEFCSKNKNDLDLNLEFGLFLANVNLKLALNKKQATLPRPLIQQVRALLKENDKLIKFFDKMVRKNKNPHDRLKKMMISLFTNETKWMMRIREFDLNPMKKPDDINTQIDNDPMAMTEYIEGINALDKWVPNPKLSDMCMVSLAGNPDYLSTTLSRCEVYGPCYDMLLNGTDFGYALSHRLLFLINARHGRGCTIFSEKQDRELTYKYCVIAFEEVSFLTQYGYEIIDLILEFITLCVVEGHAHFLQHRWLSTGIEFQTKYGCFSEYLPRPSKENATLPPPSKEWKLGKQYHVILDGQCNGHITSVAAGSLSAAIRYILEVHF